MNGNNNNDAGGARDPRFFQNDVGPSGSASSSQFAYDEAGDPQAFMADVQEKAKLLNKWSTYFPLEPPKDFDVSTHSHLLILTLAQRFQTSSCASILLVLP
jgi:hypothetical protein